MLVCPLVFRAPQAASRKPAKRSVLCWEDLLEKHLSMALRLANVAKRALAAPLAGECSGNARRPVCQRFVLARDILFAVCRSIWSESRKSVCVVVGWGAILRFFERGRGWGCQGESRRAIAGGAWEHGQHAVHSPSVAFRASRWLIKAVVYSVARRALLSFPKRRRYKSGPWKQPSKQSVCGVANATHAHDRSWKQAQAWRTFS